ncbi:MAG: extracellular solute-binding protein [Microbacterium sp.]
MSKRLAGLGGFALSFLLLAGCTGGGTGDDPAKDGEKVTLRMINWANPAANAVIEEINKKFTEANPDIVVDYQVAANTSTSYATLLQTAVASSSVDIITTNNPFQPLPDNPTRDNMSQEQMWATSGVLMPLTDQPWLANYTDSARASMTYEGEVYGVLSGVYQWMVFYDKDVFAAHGLSEPKTYTEFITIMDTLKAAGVQPLWLGAGGGAEIYVRNFLSAPLMNSVWAPKAGSGGLAKALERGDLSWDDPAFITILDKLSEVGGYLQPGWTGTSWQGMPGDFAAGRSAMLLDGSWDLSAVREANPSMNIGSFPLPGSDNAADNQPILVQDLTFAILKDAKNKDAAVKYLEFFSQPENYSQYVNATGISPSQSAGEYSSFASEVLGERFGQGTPSSDVLPLLSPLSTTYCQTPENFAKVLIEVMEGKKTSKDAAALFTESCHIE